MLPNKRDTKLEKLIANMEIKRYVGEIYLAVFDELDFFVAPSARLAMTMYEYFP